MIVCALGGTSIAGTGIQFIPFAGNENATARGMSRDGSTYVGSGALNNGTSGAILWREPGEGTLLADGWNSLATDASNNGSVIVGQNRGQPFVYSVTDGLIEVPDILGFPVNKHVRVSANGTTVVGGSLNGAFRWTRESGTEILDPPGTWDEARATAISADGSIVAGFGETDGLSSRQAWTWTESGGFDVIGRPGDTITEMTPNGHVVVGRGPNGAFRYSIGTGKRVELDGFDSIPVIEDVTGISADGSILVGSAADPLQADPTLGFIVATIWFGEDPSPVRFQEYLNDLGVNTDGWFLQGLSAISDDGQTILGWGVNDALEGRPFVVILPAPASALVLAVLPLAAHRRR
ncbi:MAG: hypothetical protein AAGD00_00065 [Planctomycetota bacterium]